MIDEKKLVDLFCELVKIDAPSLQERAMADRVSTLFKELGGEVFEDHAASAIGGNCGNLIITLPGELPGYPLLLAVHLDTVEPCRGKLAVVGEDGVIRSAGNTILGADDIAGIAAILAAIASIRADHIPHRSLEILLTVGEELHLLGSPQLDFSRLKAKEAYVLDTSGPPGLAVIQAPGHIGLVFEFAGQAAHAGIAPEHGISAIQAAARGIARLKLGRVDAETTANIGRIEGGGETNVIPDYCRVTAECRSLQNEHLLEQVLEIRHCMELGAAETGARLQVSERVSYLPYSVDPSSEVVRRFVQACDKLSLPVCLKATGGGSDNNILACHNIEGIVISCGMEKVHSCEEQIKISDLTNTARLVRLIIT